jgi:hypothetical protein
MPDDPKITSSDSIMELKLVPEGSKECCDVCRIFVFNISEILFVVDMSLLAAYFCSISLFFCSLFLSLHE